jgi:hypothetical protein
MPKVCVTKVSTLAYKRNISLKTLPLLVSVYLAFGKIYERNMSRQLSAATAKYLCLS